jgi:hypothetical protein
MPIGYVFGAALSGNLAITKVLAESSTALWTELAL